MNGQNHEAGEPLDDVDATRITSLLPHRPPFLLIDRVVDLKAFEGGIGIKNVSFGDYWFQGHFPGDPIMPGVLIVEAMAQTAAVVVVASRGRADKGDLVYFMSVDSAKFRRPVRPGDELQLAVTKERQKLGVWRFSGLATVRGDTVAEATFTAKVLEQ